jgi:hypothetical protein
VIMVFRTSSLRITAGFYTRFLECLNRRLKSVVSSREWKR